MARHPFATCIDRARLSANLPVLALLVSAALLVEFSPDLYQRSVQEDEILEWVSFWTFLAAAFVYARAAFASNADRLGIPWFLSGVALFCGLVAFEEISWGQRLLGYMPPTYFLAENFQQELNLHNTLDDSIRQVGFLVVVWGYGIVLPLVPLVSRLRGWLERLGIHAPPLELVPAFAATVILYQVYPWSHSGEWAEAMLGTAMLFVAALELRKSQPTTSPGPGAAMARSLVFLWLSTALLGIGSARLSWLVSEDDPGRVAVARVELEALRRDVGAARTRTRCGLHKRIYSMVEAYGHRHLFEGEFARLGIPEDRAGFFLDPWNSPYWVQHSCSDDSRSRAIFVYSFGPNRKRDSNDWEIMEDDLGVWISRPRSNASD